MEQGRIILAIGLSFLVFLVYDLFFVPKEPIQPTPVQPTEQQADSGSEGHLSRQKEAAPVEPQTVVPPVTPTVIPAASARSITVETPLYVAVINENGGAFTSFRLKRYKESIENNAPLKEVLNLGLPLGEYKLIEESPVLKGLGDAVFRADLEGDTIKFDDGAREVAFEWVSQSGVRVTKAFRFSADTYAIQMKVGVENASGIDVDTPYSIALYMHQKEESRGYGFEGPSGLINNSLEEIDPKKVEKQEPISGDVTWISQVGRYFIRALVPETTAQGTMKLRLVDEKVVESRLVPSGISVASGAAETQSYFLFMGPRSLEILSSAGHELKRALNFGWFDFLAKPLLWLMNQIYKVIPNYGVAIIILTILTKILLWPLGTKSYKSMAEMRKLQPLMAEIREKHKNDKKKMNEEMMGLYRTYKINPMGGCLPMVVQIPFFFALYRMLYEAIELRHAPFVGWINDLSAPDRLFEFGFAIPFMQAPYGIPVLTIVMGATMFLQQKMTPTPGDPTQAKMMMFMPIIFTVIFINFSSGLVLYWLVNNILSIGQQYLIQKKYA